MRGAGVVALVAAALVLVSGCSGSGGDEDSAGRAAASPPAVRSSAPAPTVEEALERYGEVTSSGCTDAADCQKFMTAKLAAAEELRVAMVADSPSRYAEPIRSLEEASRRADHFGRDNLGAKGNSFAVSQPIQEAIAWLRANR
ncbi:hypothetical protein Srufu_079720 (plasmid) [Streptomyces libani subsp. rufus]|nr:hypothetical protein Srufu_079720 [Streptomyces libani subsp. rufus]